jgi:hypothetical protein
MRVAGAELDPRSKTAHTFSSKFQKCKAGDAMGRFVRRRRLQVLQNKRAAVENDKAQRVGGPVLSFPIVWRMS